jgi:homoserine O-acetyltransferase
MADTDIFDSSDSVRSGTELYHAKYLTISNPLKLEKGQSLSEVTIAYETFGKLNDRRDNAVLICHALSGDSHVASHDEQDDPGWWELVVGPGRPIDTDRYFVICPNALGGCRGTTGPDSLNPETGEPYGMDFPVITIGDIVETQRILIDHLEIPRLLAVVGGSLGGLMTLEWSIRFPDRLAGSVAIATSAHLTSQALAFDIVARNAIMRDPHFHDGRYYDQETGPTVGLAIARMLGHITYLSRESMTRKFDAHRTVARQIDTQFETKFSVGSYLAHQGDKFVERFDANSYLTLSMAMDLFDLGSPREQLYTNLRQSMCRWLLISFTSDWLFPAFQSRELVDALMANGKRISYSNILSDCGHDAFLLPNELHFYGGMIEGFLKNLECEQARGPVPGLLTTPAKAGGETPSEEEVPSDSPPCEEAPEAEEHRIDYQWILDLIPPGASVLDLGCGSGELLARLRDRGHKNLMGVELNEAAVLQCIQRGLDVVQYDLNEGLPSLLDQQFDFVVLSKTLQNVQDVLSVLEEMLRIGTRGIVSFPNLGYHRYRHRLIEEGRAPRLESSRKHWYDTDVLRFLTISDFEDFCRDRRYRIHQRVALDTKKREQVEEDPNLNADVAIVVLSR